MNTQNNIEYRTTAQPVEVNDRHVSGYAIVFDSQSEDMGFREVIHKGAVTEETINQSDVFARFNHNDDKILARCKYGNGSLTLTIDETGLRYEFDAPHTAHGDELLEHLKRGDLDSSSFAFSLDEANPDNAKWHRDENGTLHRDIFHIHRLYDVAPVWQPAYAATTCTASQRAMEKAIEELKHNDEIAAQNQKIIDEINAM